eukprot:773852-Pleurochrysis_carterae.AAC.1
MTLRRRRRQRHSASSDDVELVSKESFFIPVVLTRQSRQNFEKPVLSQDCMAYLRTVVRSIEEEDDSCEEPEGEGDEKCEQPHDPDSSDEDRGNAGTSRSLLLARGSKLLDLSDEEEEQEQAKGEKRTKKVAVPEAQQGDGPAMRAVRGKRRRSARS